MQLILAEKPSVAGHIAKALKCTTKNKGYFSGSSYIVTWAYGHLLGLKEAQDYNAKYATWNINNYPIIPNPFEYKVKTSKSHSKYKGNTPQQQLTLIGQLINNPTVQSVILATDWDREGQVIGDSILKYLGCNKPVYRLLLNEWTEKEIIQEISNVKPNSSMAALSDAGFCRQQMDWLIGINFTSCMTLTKGGGNLFNVGRVILPTLKIIYDRMKLQEAFTSQNYYEVYLKIRGVDDLICFNEGPDKGYQTKQEANKKAKEIESLGKFTIIDKQITLEEEYPKALFNLTALQAYITNSFAGWTADKVLSVCQSLYEKQLITYPRTESTYLDESAIGKTKAVFSKFKENIGDQELKDLLVFKGGKSIFNSTRVHSHGAIIPTYKDPKDLSDLEYLVYMEIMLRFIAKFMPNAQHEVVEIKGKVGKENLSIRLTRLANLGWRSLYKQTVEQPSPLSVYNVGDTIQIEWARVEEKTTKRPNDFTEANVLHIMEHCGKDVNDPNVLSGYSIGTPATRGEVLSKLKTAHYVEQIGKYLKITNKGKFLIEHFPIKELLDLDFTGKIEKELSLIESGQEQRGKLDTQIRDFVKNGVQLMQLIGDRNIVGTCPVCGNYIIDGPKGYGCLGYTQGCKVILYKDMIRQVLKIEPTNDFISHLLRYRIIQVPVLGATPLDPTVLHEFRYDIQADGTLTLSSQTL